MAQQTSEEVVEAAEEDLRALDESFEELLEMQDTEGLDPAIKLRMRDLEAWIVREIGQGVFTLKLVRCLFKTMEDSQLATRMMESWLPVREKIRTAVAKVEEFRKGPRSTK